MATLYILKPGLTSVIQTGGASVQVATTKMGDKGGLIINPLQPQDQGLTSTESLWVNLLGPASTSAVNGSSELVAGQSFLVPPNSNVWVNAASAGHKFTSYFSSNYTVPYPPEPTPVVPGFAGPPFPPSTVTGLTTVIPSYLYQEYSDDDDLQGFVNAQNTKQQDYVDTFNALNLPIYPGPIVQGALLDWVAYGVYGMQRPVLTLKKPVLMGPLNTYGCNWIYPNWQAPPLNVGITFALNEIEQLVQGDTIVALDDLYRRILTWHFFKGDGKYFNMRWIKRRIWRFLYGLNGTTPDYAVDPISGVPHPGGYADPDDAFIADTKQISVTIGVHKSVAIRFVLGNRTVTGGALINFMGCNGFNPAFGQTPPWNIGTDPQSASPDLEGTIYNGPGGIFMNDLETSYVPLPPLPYMNEFKEALDSGYLEVPFQFTFTCQIG